jgi:signal peptidase
MSVITAPQTTILPAHDEPRLRRGRGRWLLRALSTAVTVAILLVGVLAIAIDLGTRTASDGQGAILGHPVMTVLSGSMNPTFRTGDIIVDKPVTAAQASHLHVGQVISFRAQPGSTQIITHRIVAVRDERGAVSYITKGDVNNSADSTPRPASDVVGTFSFAVPRAGYALVAIRTPRVIGMFVLSAGLWIVSVMLFRRAARPENS